MAMMVREVVPDYSHHVTQRGKLARRQWPGSGVPMFDRIDRWNACLSDADNNKVKI